jgi:hypothetical protein
MVTLNNNLADLGRVQYGSFAVSDIIASEILLDYEVRIAHTIPDNFAGSGASVVGNPTASWTADIQLNDVSIGYFTISTTGEATFVMTAAGPVDVAIGDIITVIGPADVDATITRLRFTILGII